MSCTWLMRYSCTVRVRMIRQSLSESCAGESWSGIVPPLAGGRGACAVPPVAELMAGVGGRVGACPNSAEVRVQERGDAHAQCLVEDADRVRGAGNDRELDGNARRTEGRREALGLAERHELLLGMPDEEGRVAGVGAGAGRRRGRLRALLGAGARLAVEVLADDALQPRGRPVGRELDRLEPDRA